MNMKRYGISAICAVLIVGLLSRMALGDEKIIKMSTTTSTQASGLLDGLLPQLDKDTGIKVKVIAGHVKKSLSKKAMVPNAMR
jgi:tungstate transport system substrate-binding protein